LYRIGKKAGKGYPFRAVTLRITRVSLTAPLVVIENLTHNVHPYSVIENVVTHANHRSKHYATELMNNASELAKEHSCYKIMLMTGSKKESTLNFYENCGFNKDDKTGFVKWL
jgi:GNAT superfamily N-acetyltransferase